jgi:Protein of unknown function, DUF488
LTQLFASSYRTYRPGMGQAVVTSLGLPKWRLAEAQGWPRCWLITPTPALFGATDEEFDREYPARLDRFGVPKIARALERIAREHQAERLVLMCFEADPARCHRSMFAQWWMSTGEVIEEPDGATS